MAKAQHRIYKHATITVGALATLSAVKGNTVIDGSRENGVRIEKMKAALSWHNKTADDGPCTVGLCNSDLSPAEVAECMVADPQKPLDTPASEQSMRNIFPVWLIDKASTGTGNLVQEYTDIRYPWKEILEGDGLSWFLFNHDSATLTVNFVCEIPMVIIGSWLDD